MSRLTDIRRGIELNIRTILTDLEVFPTRTKAPNYPCAVVGWPENYTLGVDQGDALDMIIPVWVGLLWADDESSDDQLSEYLETVPDAILTDDTLGGACDVAVVLSADNFEVGLDDAQRTVMWFQLPVTVVA
jgi:hypothetical protein